MCKSEELGKRDGPRFRVDGKDFVDTVGQESREMGRAIESRFDEAADREEPDSAVKEGLDRDLIGSAGTVLNAANEIAVPALPPAASTSRAKRSAGKRTSSGASKESVPMLARSSRAVGACMRLGQARL